MLLPSACAFDATEVCWHPGGFALTLRGLELSEFPQKALLANIGCGNGGSTRLLRHMGYSCVGIDVHIANFHSLCICANADTLPIKDVSFSGLVCECLLCLLPQKHKALAEWHRVCLPHARMLLTDVYCKKNSGVGAHIFSRQKMEEALLSAGWIIRHFEDYTDCLKDFVAQMLWNGTNTCNCHILPAALYDGRSSFSSYGYGLWIAEKEL